MKTLTSYEFKQLIRANKTFKLEQTLVTKDTAGLLPEMLDDRRVKFTISTEHVDRHNDVIKLGAWDDLTNFNKNPVVLWNHNTDQPPIGKCVEIYRDATGLHAVAQFVPQSMPVVGDLAEMTLQMCRQGFLAATSVGFIPRNWQETRDKDRGADGPEPGFDFLEADLMEFSIVPVPANPFALIREHKAIKHQSEQISINKARQRRRYLEIENMRTF